MNSTLTSHRPLPSAVIFDLDGTLVNTGPDLTAALNHVMARLGRPAMTIPDVAHLVGHGARALIRRGLATSGGGDETLVDRELPAFLDFYAAHVCEASMPYAHAEAALDALADAGVALGVCTNKPAGLATALFTALGWQDGATGNRFGALVGGDSLPVRKPDAAPLLETARLLGVAPEHCVMVGDSSVDVQAARNARMPVIGVDFGFSGPESRASEADLLITDFGDLLPALRQLTQAQRVGTGTSPE